MDKTVIEVWPIVLDPSDFSVVLNKDDSSDHFFDGGLGGDITSDLTLSRRATPYLVERSIFILYVNLSSFFPTEIYLSRAVFVRFSLGCQSFDWRLATIAGMEVAKLVPWNSLLN